MILERHTIHVSDDAGRIAMLEKRTIGTDDADEILVRYVYSNHLQSASLELDGAANIISYEEYHPYGTTAFQAKSSTINVVAKRYRYTGKERDEESGLYYHGARYYIPWLARWTAIDPMESKYAGRTPYCYGANNPIVFNDPTGNEEIKTNGTTSLGVALDPKFHPAGLENEMSIIVTDRGMTDVPYNNSNTGMGSYRFVYDSVNNQNYTILSVINQNGEDRYFSWVNKSTGQAEFFLDNATNKDASGKWTGEWVNYETAEQRIKREYGEEVLKNEEEAKQAMRTAVGFVPFVGGALDIGEGLRDGNMGQVASGSVGLALDLFGGAIFKAAGTALKSSIKMGTGGIVKTGAKEGAEVVTKEVTESAVKNTTTEAIKKGFAKVDDFIPTEGGAQNTDYINQLADQIIIAEDMVKAKGVWPHKPLTIVEVDGHKILMNGHHRLEAARKVGFTGNVPYESIPINQTPYTLEDLRKFIK